MDDQLGLAQARTQLADLVGRVSYGGARIVLTKHGKPAAALVSIADLERLRAGTPPATALHTQALTVHAQRDRVWQALTDPRQRSSWWQITDLDPEPGGQFTNFSAEPDELAASGKIMEYLAPQLFRVQWRDGTQTTVEVRDGAEERTEVVVSHTGAQPPSGWALDLVALQKYLNGD